ncbi:MAG: hypothetical protein JXA03_09895 [Bacteroidales bacterium]|nr:hypothetical protein [Bacteroidales bacterium]
MKKSVIILAVVLLAAALNSVLMAQPAPWDQSIGGGEGNYPVGGGAPLGGGLLILLTLAAGYATKKFQQLKRG